MAATHYEEGVFHGVEVVVSECCGGQGRGKACEGACNGGPGRNESSPRYPLGPCMGGVCVVEALSGDGRSCSLRLLPHQDLGCH